MNNESLMCEDCGTSKDAIMENCPYAEEICEEIVPVILCDDCYTERCQDI
tara:strand:+ start:1929 stop:2078 length:150 start_codon:yes stop_codon:yes gene_type:complete